MWVQSIQCLQSTHPHVNSSQSGDGDPSSCLQSEQKYDSNLSEFSESVKYFDSESELEENFDITVKYGIGMVKGELVEDRLCLDAYGSNCASEMEFLSVYFSEQLSNLQASGIVGLSPYLPHSASLNGKKMPRFIDQLKSQGIISRSLFSLYISDYADQSDDKNATDSHLTFGAYDLQSYASPGAQITWNSLHNRNYWTVLLSSAEVVSTPWGSNLTAQPESFDF